MNRSVYQHSLSSSAKTVNVSITEDSEKIEVRNVNMPRMVSNLFCGKNYQHLNKQLESVRNSKLITHRVYIVGVL